MTVFRHTSSGFTVLTERSGATNPGAVQNIRQFRRPGQQRRGKASSNQARLGDGSPEPEETEPCR